MDWWPAGKRYLHHLRHVRNRKLSTLQDYTIILGKHLAPHFGSKPLDRIEPYDASQIRKRFYAAMDAVGMGHRCGREGGITFHSLRHTFGTRMAAAGVPMRTLQEWMGHRNLATTEIYADYAPDPAYGAAFAERAFTAQAVTQSKARESAASSDGPGAAEAT